MFLALSGMLGRIHTEEACRCHDGQHIEISRYVNLLIVAQWKVHQVADMHSRCSFALKAGSVGVAMGQGGTDVARASADIVLLSDDLARLPTMIQLGRHCRSTVNGNVAIALGWTAITIGLAAAGIIGPVTSAIVHNLGTVGVLLNAGSLLRWQQEPELASDQIDVANQVVSLSDQHGVSMA